MKYYELINWRDRVDSVCSDDALLHELKMNSYIWTVGEITYDQFSKYGDNDWIDPISDLKNRYYAVITEKVKLEKINNELKAAVVIEQPPDRPFFG